MNRTVWDTPELRGAGITFEQDGHWWTFGTLRKARACGHCEKPLRPSTFVYVRRVGPAGYLCQLCGQTLRDRDKPRDGIAADYGTCHKAR